MRYARFLHESGPAYGVIDGEYVERLDGNVYTGEADRTGERYTLGEITLLAPTEPSKIVAVSTNYTEVLELLGKPAPAEPLLFFKAITAVIGPNEAIIYPDDSEYVTYEPELAVVIGRDCFKVTESEAMEYVFGYTCGNDLSARDIQDREIEMTRCKSYTTFAPIGPIIETELDPTDITISGYVNGTRTLHTTTAHMVFSVPEQIAFISRIMQLLPGDVILTGACGVGEIAVGDTVKIEIEDVGALRNHVIAES